MDEDGIKNENPSVYTIEKNVWLSAAEKEGYVFKGWYTKEGKRVYYIRKTGTEDITLYGYWQSRK